jgi:hypothetical protein
MPDAIEVKIRLVPPDGTTLAPCDEEVRGYSCPGCEAYWPVGAYDESRLRVVWVDGKPQGSCAKCDWAGRMAARRLHREEGP